MAPCYVLAEPTRRAKGVVQNKEGTAEGACPSHPSLGARSSQCGESMESRHLLECQLCTVHALASHAGRQVLNGDKAIPVRSFKVR